MATQDNSPASSGTGASPTDLGASVDHITQQVRALQGSYAAIRRQILFFSALTVVLMLIFGVALVSKVRENLGGDKMQNALTYRADQMWPKVQTQLVDGVRDAAPTYQALIMARMPVVAPALGNRMTHVAAEMGPQISADIVGQADAAFKRVAGRLETDLQREFPKLDHERLTKMGEKLQLDLTLPSGQLADHIKGLVAKELQRLNTTLERFPIDQYATMSEDQLGRRLVHNLLMLVDHEMELAGTNESLDQTTAVIVK
jgi:hypothetical protein